MNMINKKQKYGGRIIVGLHKCIEIMISKTNKKHNIMCKWIGIMYCFDRENHLVTNDGSVPIISFNCKYFQIILFINQVQRIQETSLHGKKNWKRKHVQTSIFC